MYVAKKNETKYYLGNQNLPTPNTSFEWTPEMVTELEVCKKNLLHFAENHFYIINIDEGRQKIALHKFQKRLLRAMRDNRFVVCTASRQIGKALALDTPIKTATGWSTMGEIEAGDVVYDEAGNLCTVTKAHDILYDRKCYKLLFDNGEEIVADGEHLWDVEDIRNQQNVVITTEQIKETYRSNSIARYKQPLYRIKKVHSLSGTDQKLLIDPYILGLWLDDKNNKVLDDISLREQLKDINILTDKHIPEIYLNSSRLQRIKLLHGLMGTDNYLSGDVYDQYHTTHKKLHDSVYELLIGLGYRVTTEKNSKSGKEYYTCSFILDTEETRYHYIREITEVESVPVRCITVDSPSHLYLAGKQLIPTHNTTVLTIFTLWLACFFPDQSVLILANKESTAIEILSRIRFAYELLPNYLKPGVKAWGKTSIELENGCKIEASTTSTDSGRGKSISCLVVDEMAYVDDLEQFFESVYPTISSSKKAKMFAISTPNGKNNLFFRLYDGAVKNINGWYPEKVNWDEVPGRDEKWKQLTLQTMGSLKSFQKEFENYFHDDSGESAFSEELHKLLEDETKKPIQVFESPKDILEIWETPVNGRIYSIGVDVAEGIGKNASTADILDITDIKNIRQVASYWTNQIEPKHFAVKVLELANKWGNPPLCIERNNHGGQVIDVLWDRYQYNNIVTYIPNAGDMSQKYSERRGIMSHTNSKYHAVMNMRYYIAEKRFVHINNINTINEYKDFKRRPNGTWGADDAHLDDRVISIMWALMILEPHITRDYFEIVDMDAQGKPLKLIPNYDTYIKTSDIIIPRRNYNYRNSNTSNLNNYDFAPAIIGNPSNNPYDDLSEQGWEPLR